MIKRIFDFLVSSFSLLILSPFLALVALLIKPDSPGQVLYRGLRVGKDGEPLHVYKFRTMADGQDSGPRITTSDDRRVTPLGRVLRRTKINELPQLFNVVRGEMSLVGPRPEDPKYVALYTSEQRRVLSVLPGMTSPATLIYWREEEMLNQTTLEDVYVNVLMPDKLKLDLEYIEHRSFLVDLDILFRTALALVPLIYWSAPDIEDLLFGPVQRLIRRHVSWFMLDFGLAFASISMAAALWSMAGWSAPIWAIRVVYFLVMCSAYSLVNQFLGLQRSMWQYASSQESVRLLESTALSTALLAMADILFPIVSPLPMGLILLSGFFTFAAFTVARYRFRLISGIKWRWRRLRGQPEPKRERVLIVGAGDMGQLLAWRLQNGQEGRSYQVVGFVDDNPEKLGLSIHGANVLGSRRRIPTLVNDRRVDLIAIAIHNIATNQLRDIVSICEATTARVKMVPDLVDLFNTRPTLSVLQDVSLSGSMESQTIRVSSSTWNRLLSGRAIMVIGAGQRLGSELCREILQLEPQHLTLVDHRAMALYGLRAELDRCGHAVAFSIVFSDATDREGLAYALQIGRPSIVFHLGGYRHGPSWEGQFAEAVRLNLLEISSACEMVTQFGVEQFVLISSYEAMDIGKVITSLNPLAEEAVLSTHGGTGTTSYTVVRMGALVDSPQPGEAKSLPHPEAMPLVMTFGQAARLIIQAAALDEGGNIFVVLDTGHGPQDVGALLMPGESWQPTSHPYIFRVSHPGQPDRESLRQCLAELEHLIHEGHNEALRQCVLQMTSGQWGSGLRLAGQPVER